MLDMIINEISNIMYSYLLIILLLAVGLYFTFRTKFIQYFFNKKTTGTISGIYNNFQIFQWRIIIICVYTITDLHAKICTV